MVETPSPFSWPQTVCCLSTRKRKPRQQALYQGADLQRREIVKASPDDLDAGGKPAARKTARHGQSRALAHQVEGRRHIEAVKASVVVGPAKITVGEVGGRRR